MTEETEKVAFEPKADVNKVTLAVQGVGLVEIDGHYETSDPLLIAALDGAEGVKRSSKAPAAKKKED